MPKYTKALLVSYMVTVSFYFIEEFYPEYEMLPFVTLAMESILAIAIGFIVILLDAHASLKRCVMFAAMIGIIRFLMGLPNLVLSLQDNPNDYAIAVAGYLLVSVAVISFYSILGLMGGKLRRIFWQQ